MKNEEKIRKAVNLLKQENEYIVLEHTKKTIDEVMKLINEFIIDNVSLQKGKRTMYDFVYEEDCYRPMMHGVFHDGNAKVAVASDGKYLVISKSDYKEEFAGEIIDKYGNKISEKYPKYRTVFDAPSKYPTKRGHKSERLPIDLCNELMKMFKAHEKMHGKGSAQTPVVKVGHEWLNARRLIDLYLFLGECDMFTIDGGNRAYIVSTDGSKEAILMAVDINSYSPADKAEVNQYRAYFIDVNDKKHFIK